MGSLRYLPVISNLNSFPSNASNEAGIDFNNVVYMIYPFFGENLPWADPTLRSLYIGPLALISLLFINFKNKKIYLWLLLAFFSIILMMDNFVNDFLRTILPLANISRFGITDWRNTLNLALIMMTILVLNNLTEKNASRNYIRIVASLSITIYFAYLGFTYKFNFIHVLFYVIMILICILLVLKINKKNILNYILLSSFIFGYLFVLDNSYAWSTTVKEQYFNIYRTDYSNIKENIIYPMQHRPKRFFFKEPPLEPDEYKSDQRYNRFWLTGGFGALGYHNIKDIPAYSSLFPRLESNNDKVINFLSSSGRQVILTNPKQIESKLDECTQFYDCNNDASIKVDQLLFLKETEKFKVSSIKEFTLVQNEIYSPVWTGKICFDNKKCQNIKSYASLDSLRSWNLPKGEYIFETNARTPLNTQRWYLFYLGLIFATTHFIFNLFNSSSSSVKNKSISS
jgi:hypothetical protein